MVHFILLVHTHDMVRFRLMLLSCHLTHSVHLLLFLILIHISPLGFSMNMVRFILVVLSTLWITHKHWYSSFPWFIQPICYRQPDASLDNYVTIMSFWLTQL